MVSFVTIAAFCGAALIRVMCLLEGGSYSYLSVNDAALIGGRRLYKARRLRQEILHAQIT